MQLTKLRGKVWGYAGQSFTTASAHQSCSYRTLDGEGDTDYQWPDPEVFEFPRPKTFDLPFSSVLKNASQLSLFVDIDPDILGGTPRIEGTRIPVYMVLNAICEHGSIAGATQAYRSLTEHEVKDALMFAVHVLESPLEYESSLVDR